VGGIERRMNSPERTRKRATESWKRTQKEEGGAEGGMAVFMVVEKAARARAPTPCLIRRPLNLGGQTPRLRLLNELKAKVENYNTNDYQTPKIAALCT
jgi:hypothetical protein